MNEFDSTYPAVQQFSDYGVRVGDSVEYIVTGYKDYSRGLITELRKDQITVKLYDNDENIKSATLNERLFDQFDLHIFDDNRGCDDSAIGCDGCFVPWKHMWF